LIAEIDQDWHDDVDDEYFFNEILNRGYRLCAAGLESCLPSPASCFAIMPFKEPFRTRYRTFYKPALERSGYELLRAWEGASAEAYISLVLGLMMNCGAALADLSAVEGSFPNGNVIHEVGMSMGLGQTLFLLCDERECHWPSNLLGLIRLDYDTGAGAGQLSTWIAWPSLSAPSSRCGAMRSCESAPVLAHLWLGPGMWLTMPIVSDYPGEQYPLVGAGVWPLRVWGAGF